MSLKNPPLIVGEKNLIWEVRGFVGIRVSLGLSHRVKKVHWKCQSKTSRLTFGLKKQQSHEVGESYSIRLTQVKLFTKWRPR